MCSLPLDCFPPSVRSHVEKVGKIITDFENLKRFINECLYNGCFGNSDEHLRGIYTYSYFCGVSTVLQSMHETINKVKNYLNNPPKGRISFLHALNECDHLTPILASLNASINKVKSGKFRGCKMINLCTSFIQCGLPTVRDVFISLQLSCLKKLFEQIKLWILQGVLNDPLNEFFIKKTSKNPSTCKESTNPSVTMDTGTMLTLPHLNSDFTLKYQLNPDNLPYLIPPSVAVKILFIGEALIMCQHNRNANSDGNLLEECGISEEKVLSQFKDMEKCENFVLRDFSSLIDDLWNKINKRIRVLSEEVGNISSELGLLSDVYLLGRGDLFQEFLLKGRYLLNSDVTLISPSNLNKAFKDAFYNVYSTDVSNLVDNFRFILPDRKCLKDKNKFVPGTKTMNILSLKYNVKWPLHYLITNEVIDNYNRLFRFLLALKKAQVDLTSVCKSINLINEHSLRMEFIEVKMHLLSIVVNLQNYCLTNVIIHEMNVLLNTIKSTELFTDLEKVFSLFLCNISNRLFISSLTFNRDSTTFSIKTTSDPLEEINKKVYTCFLKIFSLCDKFSELLGGTIMEDVTSKLEKIKNDFYKVLKVLFSLFKKIDQNYYYDDNDNSYAGHLFNLIMCLDYNKFYQNKFQLNFG